LQYLFARHGFACVLRFFLQGSARSPLGDAVSPDATCMDSFQKRQRERAKIEKRQEKDARKQERAELLSQQPLDADGNPIPLPPEVFRTPEEIADARGARDNRN